MNATSFKRSIGGAFLRSVLGAHVSKDYFIQRSWGLTVVGYARFAGFCPLVVTGGTYVETGLLGNVYKSSQPLLEKRFLRKTASISVIPGQEFYFGGKSSIDWDWRIHPDMGDLYYVRQTDSGGSVYSYDKDDTGAESSSGSQTGFPTLGGGSSFEYISSSRTESSGVWAIHRNPGDVPVGTLTIELYDPVLYASRHTDATALLATIEITTPGNYYAPESATKYTIDGEQKILCPTPREYRGTPDADYYIDQLTEAPTTVIRVAKERSASGIVSANSFILDGSLDAITPGIASSIRGAFPLQAVYDDARQLDTIGVFISQGKCLLNSAAHKWSDMGVHVGGTIDNQDTFGGIDFGTYENRTNPVRYEADIDGIAIRPPRHFQYPDLDLGFGILAAGEIVAWQRYWFLVGVDQPASSETLAGAVITV